LRLQQEGFSITGGIWGEIMVLSTSSAIKGLALENRFRLGKLKTLLLFNYKRIRMITMKIIILLMTITFGFYSYSVKAEEKQFTVGIVPQFEASKLHSIWRPILDKISEKTNLVFRIFGSTTIPSFEQEFIEGKFDFAYMNPYHLVIANKQAGYIPLVRDTGRMLHGVLVVRSDSNITSPAQLDGATLAFPAPNALGASLLMRQELTDNFNIDFKSIFVKTHDSVYLNVLLGETDGGGGVQKTLSRQKNQYKNALKILHRTKEVVPHPFVVHPSVPVDVRIRVRQAFIQLGETNSDLLAAIPIKKIGEASLSDYQPIADLGLERFADSLVTE
jgi:phosphonate transport system substrate-binding protein